MIKLTVLYGHPTSPEAFEKYYAEHHMPIALKVKGVARVELTKSLPTGGLTVATGTVVEPQPA